MTVLNKKTIAGEEIGNIDLSDKVLLKEDVPFTIQQSIRQYLASKHRGTHKTKTRSEVLGSRKKLFRQKGTGNARAGDIKSPIRRKGGVAFGPVVRDHSIKINKKIRKNSLRAVVSMLIKNQNLYVVDKLELEKPKTKEICKIMTIFGLEKALFVDSNLEKNFELACRNLPNVLSLKDTNLNSYEILRFRNLVITEKALKNIEAKLLV